MITYAKAIAHTDITRSLVLSQFKANGDRDRWQKRDRAVMAHALTLAEDYLETRRGSGAENERAKIKAVRRALEQELWP